MDGKHVLEPDESLDSLLDRVERGEEVVIKRDGKRIARLVAAPERNVEAARAAAKEILELRKRLSLDGLSIREMIDEGRKY